MTESFLDIVERSPGGRENAGDQHGGAAGSDGSGMPTGGPGNFMFATGIECSNPTIDHGRTRRDQLLECGHYDRWRDDLRLTSELGLKVLRYGLPIHRVWLGESKFDWEFADLAMAEIKRLGITPILDLCHFGLPDWVGNFQNPDFPLLFRGYCDAVAQRYPWVRYYTPVNEIYVTAKLSAKDGIWNEQAKDDRSFVNRPQAPASPPASSATRRSRRGGPTASSSSRKVPSISTNARRRRRAQHNLPICRDLSRSTCSTPTHSMLTSHIGCSTTA